MSAPITQIATPTTVAVDVDALTNGYYRVFVANSSEVLSAMATNKVTISVTRASTATTTTTPVVAACSTTCVVGDTGPGGGIVFYVHDDADDLFACGVALTSTCKYLEAAPANWLAGGDPGITWATGPNANPGASVTSSVTPAIGSGYKNSLDIVAQDGNVAASSAAVLAREYAGGSKSDWHLPSKVELNELCKYANTQTTGNTSTVCSAGTLLPGFSAVYNYWSSSEYNSSLAWYQYFGNGFQADDLKYNGNTRVRPVRAFGGTVACADGGICVVGDTGPGGGIVFYVAATNFTQTGATGSMCTTACKYLEAAPANWLAGTTGDPARTWATGGNQSTAVTLSATATAIGSGYQNSVRIVAQTGNVAATSAAVLAREYAGGSKSDWHLPSKDELNQLYLQNARVGGFSTVNYWSSSEDSATHAWFQYFGNGVQYDRTKDYVSTLVRPVRAFG